MPIVFIFLFGLFVGSFLNVLVDRLQNNENPLTGRSHCDFCKKTLAWYDLIPLLSFVSTKGRCRYCKHRLSLYYPAVELITGALFALAYFSIYNFQFTVFNEFSMSQFLKLVYGLIVVSSMIVVFFSDLKYGIIPDKIVFPAILVSLVYLFINSQSEIFIHLLSASTSLAFFLFLFLITRGRAMGFGDVKFAFLIGLVLGPIGTIIALYVAFLTGAIVGLILIVWKKKHLKYAIPFGPFLVLGFLISYYFASNIRPLLSPFF